MKTRKVVLKEMSNLNVRNASGFSIASCPYYFLSVQSLKPPHYIYGGDEVF